MKEKARARKIAKCERELVHEHQHLARLRRKQTPEAVSDYIFTGPDGQRRLSELFGDRKDLIVIHNMGRSCRYCTMWADGFNGLLPHLSDRAAFVVISPDPPDIQRKFAASRGWTFPFYSAEGTTFLPDMGFYSKKHDLPLPGVSAFHRSGRRVSRISSANFGPFDPFSPVWHLFALLKDGVNGWEPQYRYPKAGRKRRRR